MSELEQTGAIDDFAPEEPKSGWKSQFDLDGGVAVVRFRLREIEWQTFQTAAGTAVDDAIQQVAEEHRYTVESGP